jgi:undecaprenyl-diphosphatase
MSLGRILELDQRFSAKLRVAEKPSTLRNMAVLLAHSGDSWFWLLGLLGVGVFGDPAWRMRAIIIGVAILAAALIVIIIKFTVKRQRPEGEWGSLYRNTDPHSFPSGHAVRAVMIAVLAAGLGPVWFGWVALIWAPLVGLARVSMGVHYLSDVLVGAVLGILFGLIGLALAPPVV